MIIGEKIQFEYKITCNSKLNRRGVNKLKMIPLNNVYEQTWNIDD